MTQMLVSPATAGLTRSRSWSSWVAAWLWAQIGWWTIPVLLAAVLICAAVKVWADW